ncbi:hypothetical protein HDV04_002424 [Boothiomyces sp. JEL0838]|nr:hypothetical protein HDV04_002424 [Boothiomyces sp. JEL0838]
MAPKKKIKIGEIKDPSSKKDLLDLFQDSKASFPPPLMLPGDTLVEESDCEPQSFEEWLNDTDRNSPTLDRKTIYLIPPPLMSEKVSKNWKDESTIQIPEMETIAKYLKAYYCIPVKLLKTFKLDTWGNSSSSLAFTTDTEQIRIRSRKGKDAMFKRQMNLNDLIDAVITVMPNDAFCTVMVVPWDLYENSNDLFTMGRAYGGSRAAVISLGRYSPLFDPHNSHNRETLWPLSHNLARKSIGAPLQKAIDAYQILPKLTLDNTNYDGLKGLWLGRVCKTVAHEVGHCFGIEHCVSGYACSMQESNSEEDPRQPPYICVKDLGKILHAVQSVSGNLSIREIALKRYRELYSFCELHSDIHMFNAYKEWLAWSIPLVNEVK